jgi:hypothetical protein
MSIATLTDPTQDATHRTAGYLVLKEITLRDGNGDPSLHLAGTVLSAWEVESYVQKRVAEGSHRYRSLLEPLTPREVDDHRTRATSLEGDRLVNGQHISPPWPDYVGLHPEEIIQRMHASYDRGLIERVRLYEQGSKSPRASVLEYTAPAERAPWVGYDDLDVRQVLEKLGLLGPGAVHEVLAYEAAHRKRPAVLTYESESEIVDDGDAGSEDA